MTGTVEQIFLDGRKCNDHAKFSLSLLTFLLWISPGLGDAKPPDCTARDVEFCSSPCNYLKDKCNGDRECIFDLCFFLYPQAPPSRDMERCWDLPSDCTNEFRHESKRGILNKNVAYLLLKLHPYLNQTSQFGFLTSGRFRRITGNFGTEFLGKRSNNKSAGSRSSNPPTPKPTKPKFYSLPLNNFAKAKILKRDYDDIPRENRLSIRGNGRVVVGSEFLGKRTYQDRLRRLEGSEFLGKRNNDVFDGSEFLGKRLADSAASVNLPGTELLGKKKSRYSTEVKRFGNELLGKRTNDDKLWRNCQGSLCPNNKQPEFDSDDDPELEETFSSYETQKFPFGLRFCRDTGICAKLNIK